MLYFHKIRALYDHIWQDFSCHNTDVLVFACHLFPPCLFLVDTLLSLVDDPNVGPCVHLGSPPPFQKHLYKCGLSVCCLLSSSSFLLRSFTWEFSILRFLTLGVCPHTQQVSLDRRAADRDAMPHSLHQHSTNFLRVYARDYAFIHR